MLELVKSSIVSIGQNIVNAITGLAQTIIDSLHNLLVFLFVPEGTIFDNMYNIMAERFQIFFQVKDVLEDIYSFDYNNDMPHFKITLFGVQMDIIDFTLFSQYRKFIHNIIIFLAYYGFLKYLLHTAPAVINGLGTTEMVNSYHIKGGSVK